MHFFETKPHHCIYLLTTFFWIGVNYLVDKQL
jgi:hypothetical protein